MCSEDSYGGMQSDKLVFFCCANGWRMQVQDRRVDSFSERVSLIMRFDVVVWSGTGGIGVEPLLARARYSHFSLWLMELLTYVYMSSVISTFLWLRASEIHDISSN